MVDLISVIQWTGYAFILGIVIPIIFIKYKRSHYKGKVFCTFYLKTRKREEKFLKPNARDLMEWNKGYYLYNEDHIVIGRHWLAGTVPILTYIENNPLPTSLRGYTSEGINNSARQLAADFEDNAMQIFAETMDTSIRDSVSKQIKNYFMVMFISIVGIIGIVGFILYSRIQEIISQLGTPPTP